ncbi:MAG: phosphatase PAP2 family protein [Caulobacteraceae bacterium]
MKLLCLARPTLGLALSGLVVLGGSDAAAQAPRAEGARASLPGYLGAGRLPDERIFLPAPPADRSIAGKADLATFKATRAQAGTARWNIAANDAIVSNPALLADFNCSLGMSLTPAQTPALAKLSARAMRDALSVVGTAKDRYQRPRPFLRAKGPTCVAMDGRSGGGSYPSGHATAGWLYALVLAELAPAQASQVLARGRAYGESRVVCGVHYISDIEAGRTTAGAVFAALHASPEFQADMAAARIELSALSADGSLAVDSKACAAEHTTLLNLPW